VIQAALPRTLVYVAATAAFSASALAAEPATKKPSSEPLNVGECVAMALKRSPQVQAARANVALRVAQVGEVDALVSPRVEATGYLAPMYGAEGGLTQQGGYKRDFTKWGPYAHADARLLWPLSTFGRHTAGKKAASSRADVEREKLREVEHAVRHEVRRLYGLRLFARSMQPSLDNATKILASALETAREKYDEGTGEVTIVSVMRLEYGAGELARASRRARDGAKLATLALRQAMGLDPHAKVTFSDNRLKRDRTKMPKLAPLLTQALSHRPEARQLKHGKTAVTALVRSERLSALPVLFAAAVGQVDWSPVRPKGYSAVLQNQFNDVFAGVAVGLRWSWTPAADASRVRKAEATRQWVLAQGKRAATGIPLQVEKARMDLQRHNDMARVARGQVKSTRKWMTFSAAAYAAGTGEAKDVLEGIGAYLLAKKAWYEHLLGAWQARADLEQAVGSK